MSEIAYVTMASGDDLLDECENCGVRFEAFDLYKFKDGHLSFVCDQCIKTLKKAGIKCIKN